MCGGGISDGTHKGFDWGRMMYRDVLGAAIYARDVLGWSRVACIGVSNGAAIALLACAMDDGHTFSTSCGERMREDRARSRKRPCGALTCTGCRSVQNAAAGRAAD